MVNTHVLVEIRLRKSDVAFGILNAVVISVQKIQFVTLLPVTVTLVNPSNKIIDWRAH